MARKKTKSAAQLQNSPSLQQLGLSRSLWDALLSKATAEISDVQVLWKTYGGKSGTQCVLRLKDRNLMYLKPQDGAFLVSTALSDEAVARLGDSELPRALIDEISAGKVYPEGRAARVRVDSAAVLQIACMLLGIKRADAESRRER